MLIILTLGLGTVQAEAIDIVDNHGGRVDLYDQRWAGLAAGNPQVRVTGPCKSACTVLLKHVPRGKICVTPEASFAFHQALRPEMTKLLWNGYPADIRAWITSRGGLPPPRTTLVWMRAPETFRFFKKCA
jgi:hypothetical protein